MAIYSLSVNTRTFLIPSPCLLPSMTSADLHLAYGAETTYDSSSMTLQLMSSRMFLISHSVSFFSSNMLKLVNAMDTMFFNIFIDCLNSLMTLRIYKWPRRTVLQYIIILPWSVGILLTSI